MKDKIFSYERQDMLSSISPQTTRRLYTRKYKTADLVFHRRRVPFRYRLGGRRFPRRLRGDYTLDVIYCIPLYTKTVYCTPLYTSTCTWYASTKHTCRSGSTGTWSTGIPGSTGRYAIDLHTCTSTAYLFTQRRRIVCRVYSPLYMKRGEYTLQRREERRAYSTYRVYMNRGEYTLQIWREESILYDNGMHSILSSLHIYSPLSVIYTSLLYILMHSLSSLFHTLYIFQYTCLFALAPSLSCTV